MDWRGQGRDRRAEKKLGGWSMKVVQEEVDMVTAQGCILKAPPTSVDMPEQEKSRGQAG